MNFITAFSNPLTRIKTALLALLLMCSITAASAAMLTSTVNRNSMSTSETLVLSVTYDEQVDASALNLDGLSKDFEILRVAPRNSTSISTINGKTRRVASTQWNINLAAKRAGELRIPAFTINQSRSRAITIKVTTSDSSTTKNASQASPLIAIGLAEKLSVYPNEQLIYTIELSAAANVRDISGSALEITGANVELIDQQQLQRIENGLARTIVSLKYAIFAEESGTLTIPSITFTGLIGAQRSLFGNQGQQVVGRTQALSVTVKPKPQTNAYTWFPAQHVSVQSSWSSDPHKLQTGVPIVRTITVNARGQLANAIPPFNQLPPSQTSIKSYKDKPQLSSSKTNNGFASTRVESEAIVVSAAGEIELPAIVINWFNVNTQAWEQATFPAEKLTVSGQAIANPAMISTPNTSAQQTTLASTPAANSSPTALPKNSHWAWPLATALLALICLLQWIFLFLRKPKIKQKKANVEAHETESVLWKQLSSDLKSDEPKRIRSSLIAWARCAHPQQPTMSLESLTEQVDSTLAMNIKKLEESLFSNNSNVQLNEFISEFKSQLSRYRQELIAHKKAENKAQNTHQLAPLYPNN